MTLSSLTASGWAWLALTIASALTYVRTMRTIRIVGVSEGLHLGLPIVLGVLVARLLWLLS